MVAAPDSSAIPQASTIGNPSAWKNSSTCGPMGAAPEPASLQASRPTMVSSFRPAAFGLAALGLAALADNIAVWSSSQTLGTPFSMVGLTCGAILNSCAASGQKATVTGWMMGSQ